MQCKQAPGCKQSPGVKLRLARLGAGKGCACCMPPWRVMHTRLVLCMAPSCFAAAGGKPALTSTGKPYKVEQYTIPRIWEVSAAAFERREPVGSSDRGLLELVGRPEGCIHLGVGMYMAGIGTWFPVISPARDLCVLRHEMLAWLCHLPRLHTAAPGHASCMSMCTRDACTAAQELKTRAGYEDKKAAVEAFNAEHQWRKRGLAMIPCT